MIRNFKHKGLNALFLSGYSAKVNPNIQSRTLRRLDVLSQCKSLYELNIPGFNFHGLLGKPKRYSIHINGNFCLTFGFEEGEVTDLDLEDYH